MHPEQKWGCTSTEGGEAEISRGKSWGQEKLEGALENIESALPAVFTRMVHEGSARPA